MDVQDLGEGVVGWAVKIGRMNLWITDVGFRPIIEILTVESLGAKRLRFLRPATVAVDRCSSTVTLAFVHVTALQLYMGVVMAVFGYVRVSTERQADEGESLGAQERRLRGYAMQHNLVLDQVFIERGVSGSIPLSDRPEGAKLMVAVKRGDVILTPKLDRCFRSALDALDVLNKLKVQGVSLHMLDLGGDVTGNGISKLVFTILSAVAEAERDRIRERITDVKRDQRIRGRYLGGTLPFGWQVGAAGQLIPLADQQDAISVMLKMQEDGASLRTIAEAMRVRGHGVTHMSVRRILRDAQAAK